MDIILKEKWKTNLRSFGLNCAAYSLGLCIICLFWYFSMFLEQLIFHQHFHVVLLMFAVVCTFGVVLALSQPNYRAYYRTWLYFKYRHLIWVLPTALVIDYFWFSLTFLFYRLLETDDKGYAAFMMLTYFASTVLTLMWVSKVVKL